MTQQAMDSFEKALGSEQSSWHEYNLECASEVLAQFSISDWTDLKATVLSKPFFLQERCAEAVGVSENSLGVPVLTALLESSNHLVASVAASELDNMSISLPLQFESKLRRLLDYLNRSNSPRSKDVQRLIDNLV